MSEHPIEGLMKTTMESIKEMVDVNTIVGDAVQAPDGTVIIPISRVTFGFASGGGEYRSGVRAQDSAQEDEEFSSGNSGKSQFPFAGGSGAGVSINPVAFMVVGQNQIKLLPVSTNHTIEKVIDLVPELMKKANETLRKKVTIKKEIKTDDNNGKVVEEIQNE